MVTLALLTLELWENAYKKPCHLAEHRKMARGFLDWQTGDC